jgi:acyl dehydratase
MSGTSPLINLRYEDIALGMTFESSPHIVTPADIADFADVTRDHHPLHVDQSYAQSRGFPAVIAHGLFGLSLMIATSARHTSLILTRTPDESPRSTAID